MIQVELLTPQVNTLGLVAQYKLQHGPMNASEVFDYSLNGLVGTLTGSTIFAAYPGLDLAGVDEHIDVGSPLESILKSSFTIIIWAKVDDGQPGSQTILIGEQDGTSFVNMALTGGATPGRIAFRLQAAGNKGTDAITTAQLDNGTGDWKFCAGVMDATLTGPGGKVIYVDGVVSALGANDGDTTDVVSADYVSTENLVIGATNNGGVIGSFTGGLYGEVLIFNVAKTAAEIRSIYEITRSTYGV